MMKPLLLVAILALPAFADEIVCHDEGPHGIVCHKPDLGHEPGDTRIDRARYHVERLHLMLTAIEGKAPLQPLPAFDKTLAPISRTKTDPAQLQLDLDLGDDISTQIR